MKTKTVGGISMLAIALFAWPIHARAETNQAIEAQIQSLQAQLQALQAEVKKSQTQVKTLEKRQVAIKINVAEVPRKAFVPPMFAHAPGQTPTFTFGNQQVSFTPYGLMSLGLRNVSNLNGKSANQLMSSLYQADRLGGRLFFKLTDNYSVASVFELGYNGMDGSLGQGGRIFGRQLYVGLVNNKYGMISAGRQLDDMSSAIWWSVGITQFGGGGHVGDSDNLAQTFRLNNDIKYTTPEIHHIQASASYAFSNSTDNGDNRAYSAGISYNNQKPDTGLRLGGGVLVINKPVSSTNSDGAVDSDSYGFSSPFTKSLDGFSVKKHSILALGSEYRYHAITVGGDYSNVSFKYMDATSLRLQNIEGFSLYKVTPNLMAAGSIAYSWGHYSNGQDPHYTQFSGGLNYFLGQYVTLFVIDIYQKAGGSAQNAWVDLTSQKSTTKTQNIAMSGVRIAF